MLCQELRWCRNSTSIHSMSINMAKQKTVSRNHFHPHFEAISKMKSCLYELHKPLKILVKYRQYIAALSWQHSAISTNVSISVIAQYKQLH